MKYVIYSILLSISIVFTACGSSGDSSGNGSSDNKEGLEIFPNDNTVHIALGGSLQLQTVYKDSSGRAIEKKDDNITIVYSVGKGESLSVSKGGLVQGLKNGGPVKLTATLTDHLKGKSFSDSVNIQVNVVNLANLYINPSVLTFESFNDEKDLLVIGTDKTDFPVKLLETDISFKLSKPSLFNLVKSFNDEQSKVKITTNTNRDDYSFITPIFNYSGINISGSPTLAQIQTTPQPNKPNDSSLGGKEISFINTYNSNNKRVLNVAHSDGVKKIYYQKLDNGKWKEQTISPKDSLAISNLKLIEKDGNLFIIAFTGNNIYLTASDDKGNTWGGINIIKNIAVESIDIEVINGVINMVYIDKSTKELKLSTYALSTRKLETKVISTNEYKELDITVNNKNELRMVLRDDKNVYYASQENGVFYRELITNAPKAKNIKIIYDKIGNPNILFFNNTRESAIEIHLRGGLLTNWKSKTITKENFGRAGLKDKYSPFFLDDIHAIDAYYDSVNALKIVVSESRDVYYIKEHLGSEDTSFFRIDRVASDVGARFISTGFDDANRLAIFYSYSKINWLRFWAEPILFDYQDRVAISSIKSDAISSGGESL